MRNRNRESERFTTLLLSNFCCSPHLQRCRCTDAHFCRLNIPLEVELVEASLAEWVHIVADSAVYACHRLPVSSQANSSVFCLSLCLSPFPHSLFFFFFLKNPPSTSPLRFPQKYLEERKKKIVGLSFLPMMEEFFVVLKLGFFWRGGGRRRIGGFISTRFTTGTFASLLAVVPMGTRFVCRRSSFLV